MSCLWIAISFLGPKFFDNKTGGLTILCIQKHTKETSTCHRRNLLSRLSHYTLTPPPPPNSFIVKARSTFHFRSEWMYYSSISSRFHPTLSVHRSASTSLTLVVLRNVWSSQYSGGSRISQTGAPTLWFCAKPYYLAKFLTKTVWKQECIPVGCVLPAQWPSGGVGGCKNKKRNW